MEKDRLIDQQYFQNSETQRNMWFNYSDPYFVDNQDVKEYQKEIVEKEKKMNDKNNNVNVNNSKNVYQNSTPTYELQKDYVENTDSNNRGSSQTERNAYHENCDNFKADTESASNYSNKNSSDKNNANTHNQQSDNKNQSGSGLKNFKNATETTWIPEPYPDIESHINFNTAPQYAGDNHFASGGQTISQTTAGFENIETIDYHSNNNSQTDNQNHTKNQTQNCGSKSSNNAKQQSKKPANTTQNQNYYDTDYSVNHDGRQNRED